MKRALILLLVLSLGANVSLAVRQLNLGGEPNSPKHRGDRTWPAHGDTQAWHDRVDRRAEHMSHRLGLDSEQSAVFRRHHRDAALDMLQRREEVEEGRRAIRRLVLQDPVDRAAVREAIGRLADKQAAMDSLVAEKLLDEVEMLAPEQRVKLLGMLGWDHGDRSGPRGAGRGMGQHRHEGPHGTDGR